MLYPVSNKHRSILNLNGIWKMKCVDDAYLPNFPVTNYKLMAVPSSVNDIVVKHVVRSLSDKFNEVFVRGDSYAEKDNSVR